MSAVLLVVASGILGLGGTAITAVVSRRGATDNVEVDKDTLALDTLRLALDTQGKQLDRQEERIDDLEAEVRSCHDERDADRRTYRAELDQLRAQIGAP